jgi:sec-independent protein translocase protein TatA
MDLSIFSLSIAGTEWFILVIMAIIIIFPSKIQGISKTMGKYIGEFEKTKKKLVEEKNSLYKQASPLGHEVTYQHKYKGPSIYRPVASEREKLEIIAKSLNISTENKLDDELKNLISSKLNEKFPAE